jgi:hypothetical protein
MKNLLLVTIVLISVMTFGQKRHGVVHTNGASVTADTTAVKTSKWSKYVAVGLSISSGNDYGDNTNNTTFDEATYPSIEFGFSRENISLGLVLGRGNLRGLGDRNYVSGYEQIKNKEELINGDPIYTSDNLGNYYWEVKATPTFPLGIVNASIIFGAGSYFSNGIGNTFIEYGSGISYSVGKFTYGVCYTNWDGVDYITPNVSYGF